MKNLWFSWLTWHREAMFQTSLRDVKSVRGVCNSLGCVQQYRIVTDFLSIFAFIHRLVAELSTTTRYRSWKFVSQQKVVKIFYSLHCTLYYTLHYILHYTLHYILHHTLQKCVKCDKRVKCAKYAKCVYCVLTHAKTNGILSNYILFGEMWNINSIPKHQRAKTFLWNV